MIIINNDNFYKLNFNTFPIDVFWNTGEEKEYKIHRIHAYPAKFPYFITTKALEYAKFIKHDINTIADIFCGCGTTAFEARRNQIDYWGCDINPVATLIAKTKSRKYKSKLLNKYMYSILKYFTTEPIENHYPNANSRLKYWYYEKQYNELKHLKNSIITQVPPNSDYLLFFLCAFSNILKKTSIWLTKSIKPQVDPQKVPADTLSAFTKQYYFMLSANDEIDTSLNTKVTIKTGSILSERTVTPIVDLIITSPPYVTSYEYADLHQLSSLWLDYSKDYRDLRMGSIGSIHHDYNFSSEWKRLNITGHRIVSLLLDQHKIKAQSVAKYFLDMQAVSTKAYNMLNVNGHALFVVGNTEYKGVRIENAQHLVESLLNAGFKEIRATKRKISKKILTPYRDKLGKFSSDSTHHKIYNEEFILIGRK